MSFIFPDQRCRTVFEQPGADRGEKNRLIDTRCQPRAGAQSLKPKAAGEDSILVGNSRRLKLKRSPA